MNSRTTTFITMVLCLFSTVAMTQGPDPGFENIHLWRDLAADTKNLKDGSQSGRWEDTVSNTRVQTNGGFPSDMSSYAGFKIWVRSERPTEARIAFVFLSDNDQTDGDDYFLHTFPVDWAGWKQIDIPFSGMREIRNPPGWSNIREVRFASEGYTVGEPSPETELNFDRIEFYGSKNVGPIDATLSEATNLNWTDSITEAISAARSEDKLIFIAVDKKDSPRLNDIINLCNNSSVKDKLQTFTLCTFDPDTNRDETGFFNIEKTPTLLVYRASGQELLRITNIPDPLYFVGFLNSVSEKKAAR